MLTCNHSHTRIIKLSDKEDIVCFIKLLNYTVFLQNHAVLNKNYKAKFSWGNFVGHAQMTFKATLSDLYEMMVCEQVKLFTGNFN